MRVLVTGRGTSGSWAIRGEQLGRAIGATVERQATTVAGYDLAIVVKRAPDDLLNRLRSAKLPIVWDVVDAWPQPAGNLWTDAECRRWLTAQVAHMKPAAIVAATRAMAADCGVFKVPTVALPHHSRPGQRVNPINERVRKVGYEGGPQYLGKWEAVVSAECARRGWEFVVNPAALADVDLLVALREANGYAPRNWKSNVKLANAQGSGTPIVCNREAGYLETASGGEFFADTEQELSASFDRLADYDTRKMAAAGLWARDLNAVATEYKAWLQRLNF